MAATYNGVAELNGVSEPDFDQYPGPDDTVYPDGDPIAPERPRPYPAPVHGFHAQTNRRIYDLIDDLRSRDWARANGPHNDPFGPYHEINVVYPALDLLRPGEFVHEIVPDCSSEYNPLDHVVDDRAATNNAGRNTLAENDFNRRSEASSTIAASSALAQALVQGGPLTLNAIDFITSCQNIPGSTKISAVTYQLEADPPNISRATVRVDVVIRGPEGYGPGAHEFNFSNIYSADHGHPLADLITGRMLASHNWSADLFDLLHGASPRAMKHRLLHYDNAWRRMSPYDPEREVAREVFETRLREDYRFQPKRQPDYYSVLNNILTVPTAAMIAAKDIEDRSCIVCTDDYNQGPSNRLPMNAVITPCPGRHLCCRRCVLDICTRSSPETASCPQCGNFGKLFNPAHIEFLKYGVDSNGDFRLDVRYQHWEETQRSLADLDKCLTNSVDRDVSGQEIRRFDVSFVHAIPDMFLDIWTDMIEIEAAYPDEEDFHPVLFPEFEQVIRTVALAMFRDRGVRGDMMTTFDYLTGEIHNEFLRQTLSRGGHIPFTSTSAARPVSDFQQAVNGNEAARYRIGLYRPGLEELVKRSLSRALQFLRLRECSCVVGYAQLPYMDRDTLFANRKHMHGGRVFYTYEVYRWLFPYQ